MAISAADRHPDLDYAATIHHGIDLKEFTPRTTRGDYPAVFFGRIHPDNGAHVERHFTTERRADGYLRLTTACSAMRLTTHPDSVEGGMHTTRRERNCYVTHCGRTHG